MKKIKRLLAMLLAVAVLLSLAACGGAGSASETAAGSSAPDNAASAAEEDPADEAPEASAAEVAGDDAAEAANGFVSYSLPLADDNPTLSIWTGSWWGYLSSYFESYSDTLFWKEFAEQAGINIKFTVSSDPWTDVPLMVAANISYDLVEGLGSFYAGGETAAVKEEFIVDIASVLDQAPNYNTYINSNPDYLKNVTNDDGNIPAFYRFASEVFPSSYLWIDKTQMNNAGITELPKTIDEYHDMLTAMLNYTGSAPLWIGNTGGYTGSVFGSAYGTHVEIFADGNSSAGIYVVDGVVKLSAYEEGFKDYFELMSAWWSEGLIYKDFVSVPSNMGANEDAIKRGIAVTPRDLTQYAELCDFSGGDEWVAGYTPVVNEGDQLHLLNTGNLVDMGWYIPTNAENPDLAITVMDYFYSPEGVILSNYGFEDVTMHYENGTPVLDLDALYNTEPFTGNNNASRINFLGMGNSIGVVDNGLIAEGYDDYQKNAIEVWNSNGDSDYCYPTNYSFTEAETDRYNTIANDISTYIMENMPKFLMGELNLESDYDNFIAVLDSLYAQEFIALYQAAYDRYIAR